MNIKEIIQRLRTAMDDARCEESHFQSWLIQNEGICDAIDALKELDNSQRTWVGLTEAQCGVLWKTNMTPFEYYQAIEAALRSKNT